MFSKIVSTVETTVVVLKTMCSFDVLFWMVKSGTFVPHDLYLCLKKNP